MRAFLAVFLMTLFGAATFTALSSTEASAQSCSALRGQLAQAKRAERSRGVRNGAKSTRLMRDIRQRCGRAAMARKERRGVRREGKSGRNIFSQIFGRGRDRGRNVDVARVGANRRRNVERINLGVERTGKTNLGAERSLATIRSGRVKGSSRVGNSRTMCVRLCDGFYFPINNRSHSDNYYDELAMCVGRCPGADVSLYVHYQGEAVERMRSAMTGEAYVNLPTAFSYRKELSPSCGCSNGTRIARGGGTASGLDFADASAATGVASDAPRGSLWRPMQALYDDTGKPLPISRTAYGAKQRRERLQSGAATPAPLALSAAERTAPLAEATTELADFNPTDDEVRPVGPQFFSEAVAQHAAAKEKPRQPRSVALPTSITVTPLRPRAADEAAIITTPLTGQGG